ncbi:hypothetical protein ILYODFUR_005089, partial [Ilyodon furcidens]
RREEKRREIKPKHFCVLVVSERSNKKKKICRSSLSVFLKIQALFLLFLFSFFCLCSNCFIYLLCVWRHPLDRYITANVGEHIQLEKSGLYTDLKKVQADHITQVRMTKSVTQPPWSSRGSSRLGGMN